jgi:hypothetical protein
MTALSSLNGAQKTNSGYLLLIASMAPCSHQEGWIDWKKCDARAIILEDLELGILPIEMPAAEAWTFYYQNMAEFVKVVFNQFKE